LLEALKSDNALLRNSLRYLAFSIGAPVPMNRHGSAGHSEQS
jgi:hypothetical protein